MSAAIDLQHARARARRKLFQPTLMAGAGGETRVHLLDLSATGAQVHAADPPAISAPVRIGCAGIPRAARVVWVRGNRFGVIFAVPLTAAEVAATVG